MGGTNAPVSNIGGDTSPPSPPVPTPLHRGTNIVKQCNDETTNLVVVSAEILEVSEADVGETNHYGDDQHRQREHGGRRDETCGGG